MAMDFCKIQSWYLYLVSVLVGPIQMLFQTELTNPQADLKKIKDETRKVHQMYGPVCGILAFACVLATSGKPSTWLPLGGETRYMTSQDSGAQPPT